MTSAKNLISNMLKKHGEKQQASKENIKIKDDCGAFIDLICQVSVVIGSVIRDCKQKDQEVLPSMIDLIIIPDGGEKNQKYSISDETGEKQKLVNNLEDLVSHKMEKSFVVKFQEEDGLFSLETKQEMEKALSGLLKGGNKRAEMLVDRRKSTKTCLIFQLPGEPGRIPQGNQKEDIETKIRFQLFPTFTEKTIDGDVRFFGTDQLAPEEKFVISFEIPSQGKPQVLMFSGLSEDSQKLSSDNLVSLCSEIFVHPLSSKSSGNTNNKYNDNFIRESFEIFDNDSNLNEFIYGNSHNIVSD